MLAALGLRCSGVHGKGVYTTRLIREGTRIIDTPARTFPGSKRENCRHTARKMPTVPSTILWKGDVIDAGNGGNAARWINHSCEPNCTTEEEDNRIFVHALRTIYPGEELFYD